jgi:predicted ATP-binding protein involved in virulence
MSHLVGDLIAYENFSIVDNLSIAEINNWLLLEIVAKAQQGRERLGFQAVKKAIKSVIENAEELEFDVDRKEIVFMYQGSWQPFSNLSGGQKMMIAMVFDIAIKAIKLNSFLFGPGKQAENDPLKLLELTPGMVLIDELDVHLHPRWQRQVAANLKKTFPNIQFVCTSHSPQIIGELEPDEIRILDGDKAYTPSQSYGMDSNRVLEEIMGGRSRNKDVEDKLSELHKVIDEENFAEAKKKLEELKKTLGENDPEVIHANSSIAFLEGAE